MPSPWWTQSPAGLHCKMNLLLIPAEISLQAYEKLRISYYHISWCNHTRPRKNLSVSFIAAAGIIREVVIMVKQRACPGGQGAGCNHDM